MILISACLAGIKCRYDAKSRRLDAAAALVGSGEALPVCPELLAGLPCPRPCCEIDEKTGRVVCADGRDLTAVFAEGARRTLAIARAAGVKKAVLKSKSPSCGRGRIYDGTFSGRLIEGDGLAARLLAENGIEVFTEDDLGRLG